MTKSTFKIKNQNINNYNYLSLEIAENFISYRRLINVAEMNIMWMASDIEKATIQTVLDATSFVPISCILLA